MGIRIRQGKKGISYEPYIDIIDANGKRKQIYGTTCKKQAEAKKIEKAMMLKKDEYSKGYLEQGGTDNKKKKINENKSIKTWDDVFNDFIRFKKSQKVSFTVIAHAESRYRRYIKEPFGNTVFTETTKQELIDFRANLCNIKMENMIKNRKGGLSNRTINKIMELFKSMFTFETELLDLDIKCPFTFSRLKENNKEFDFYNPSEFKKFITVIDDLEDKILFTMLFSTGVRIGEATVLTFADVLNSKNRKVYICKTRKKSYKGDGGLTVGAPKTESSNRYVIFSDDLINLIKERRELLQAKYLDFNDDWPIIGAIQNPRNPLNDSTIRRHNEKYAELANLDAIRIHDFRGSFCTAALDCTANAKIVSKLMGHSDTSTTMKYYAKVRDEDLFGVSDSVCNSIGL